MYFNFHFECCYLRCFFYSIPLFYLLWNLKMMVMLGYQHSQKTSLNIKFVLHIHLILGSHRIFILYVLFFMIPHKICMIYKCVCSKSAQIAFFTISLFRNKLRFLLLLYNLYLSILFHILWVLTNFSSFQM